MTDILKYKGRLVTLPNGRIKWELAIQLVEAGQTVLLESPGDFANDEDATFDLKCKFAEFAKKYAEAVGATDIYAVDVATGTPRPLDPRKLN